VSTPQPVVKSAALAALSAFVTALLGLLVAFGVDLSTEQQNAVLGFVAALSGAVGVVAPLLAGYLSAREVTPLSAPRDNEGNVLVPARRQTP
jgi:hypothetical protein